MTTAAAALAQPHEQGGTPMRLRQEATYPYDWLLFDDKGHLVARGHLEVSSLPSGTSRRAIVEFVADWEREDE